MNGAATRLVVHLLHQLDTEAAELRMLNLIRHMSPARYRHAIVCLKDHAGHGALLRQHGVQIISLGKREGKDFGHYLRLFRTLRRLQPDLIHTRNLCGLEAQLVAALAGIKLRVHGEDCTAPGATHLKYHLLRCCLRPWIGHFITVSGELQRWLIDSVGAPPARVSRIAVGVDSTQFHPRLGPPALLGPPGFMVEHALVIGGAGNFEREENLPLLVEAFLRLLDGALADQRPLRLLLAGDGPERARCLDLLHRAGQAQRAWLPGRQPDLAQLMRAMDVFVLPASGQADSALLLRAMASGLPVVASAVGRNAELIGTGFTGILVPAMTPCQLAAAIGDYGRLPELAARHGARARAHVLAHHGLPAMAQDYMAVYDALASRAGA